MSSERGGPPAQSQRIIDATGSGYFGFFFSSFLLDHGYSTATSGWTQRSTGLKDSDRSEPLVVRETAAPSGDVAMALLQPQQQQNWFFIDLEDDSGICEVEVVGRFIYLRCPLVIKGNLNYVS